MSDVEQVVRQLRRATKMGLGELAIRLPKPEGCGCKRRAERMYRQLRDDEPLAKVVRDLIADFAGKRVD